MCFVVTLIFCFSFLSIISQCQEDSIRLDDYCDPHDLSCGEWIPFSKVLEGPPSRTNLPSYGYEWVSESEIQLTRIGEDGRMGSCNFSSVPFTCPMGQFWFVGNCGRMLSNCEADIGKTSWPASRCKGFDCGSHGWCACSGGCACENGWGPGTSADPEVCSKTTMTTDDSFPTTLLFGDDFYPGHTAFDWKPPLCQDEIWVFQQNNDWESIDVELYLGSLASVPVTQCTLTSVLDVCSYVVYPGTQYKVEFKLPGGSEMRHVPAWGWPLCHGLYGQDADKINQCSGNGTCWRKDECHCYEGYIGDLCDMRPIPSPPGPHPDGKKGLDKEILIAAAAAAGGGLAVLVGCWVVWAAIGLCCISRAQATSRGTVTRYSPIGRE